jgi:nucleoside-diphosphate-sugar epimerase
MRVLITGAAGMLGRKLTARLGELGEIGGATITSLELADVVGSPSAAHGTIFHVVDLAEPGVAEDLVAGGVDVVFHLAGVVSGEAEADFDKGIRVNLDGTRQLFDALRHAPGAPRVVFTSSIAVFGAPFPDPIPDDFHCTPLTSYGMEKLVGEALLADYSRRGFFDGIGIRLPTISVRPGAPNAAASGFFSGIIREPLNGQRAVLPVSRDVRHHHASPRAAIGFLEQAAAMDTGPLGARRNLTMPGISVTVGEQIEALERVAGADAAALIDEVPDPVIEEIVAGWPRRFATPRAESLGFRAEASYDEIIQAYIDDDLQA